MNEILDVKNLSITFSQYINGFTKKDIETIHNLNLKIHEKEIVAVVGASGSGKSLLVHSILGILPYNATVKGEINFYKEPLDEKKQKKLRGKDIVFVPQSVSYLNPLIKINSQIRSGKFGSKAKEKVVNILNKYGLDKNVGSKYPFQLSGGMIRRILISTAVYNKPKLILADEPTPGLDLKTAKRVMKHFQELADEGVGVLLITHDLEIALEVADRIVVFYGGTTIEDIEVSHFNNIENLKHPYTKSLYKAMPQNGFHTLEIEHPDVNSLSKDGCIFKSYCSNRKNECSGDIPWQKTKSGYVRCILKDEVDI